MKNLAGIILLMSFQVCLAFDSDLISERPGQALSPNCLSKGNVQVQSGIDYNSYTYTGFSSFVPSEIALYPMISSLSNTVVRFGMGEKFEINTGFNYQINEGILKSPIVGFKASIFNHEKAQISLQYNTVIHQFNKEPFNSSLKLISAHELTEKSGFTWNAGIDYTPIDDELNGNYVMSFSINPTNKIGLVFENYGSYTNRFNTYFDVGIGYLVTPLLQFDTYFGGGINNKDEEVFISGGLTYRFDFKKDE